MDKTADVFNDRQGGSTLERRRLTHCVTEAAGREAVPDAIDHQETPLTFYEFAHERSVHLRTISPVDVCDRAAAPSGCRRELARGGLAKA